jgi:putative colanic acid biosynthesis UDP-glucose lipid carrier transferase
MIGRKGFALIAAVGDLAAILVAAAFAGVITQIYKYQVADVAKHLGDFSLLIAVMFLAANLFQGDYVLERYFAFRKHLRRGALMWMLAFLNAVAVEFMTRTTTELSRFAVCLFLGFGLVAVLVERFALTRWLRAGAERGAVALRRILLVGYEDEINAFHQRFELDPFGLRVVTASVLRGPKSLDEDLPLAAASARICRPDDVFILVPWADKEVVEQCVNAFLRVPAAIHLGPEHVLDRFAGARVDSTGPISSLNLARPSELGHIVAKRLFDIVASVCALICLSPLMVALAIAIKLDSPGPAIFRQRRYGFNQEPFKIYKFRTMRALEDDRNVRQATAQDRRVTRLGRFMRRTNLDELPQLINVFLGDMSLVGPRPHALAHDQLFEPSVVLYARRHNVKPGITGWAQVNGLRGEINEASLKARIEHDLYYIDHMSLWFDLQIIWRTLMSKKAFENAF